MVFFKEIKIKSESCHRVGMHVKNTESIDIDDGFFSTGTGLERIGVVGPDLDCWRAGLQAPGSSGLR